MTPFVDFVFELKHIIASVGLVAFWIFDKSLAPNEEDLPFRLKVLLTICFIVSYFYTVHMSEQERQTYFPLVLMVFVGAFLIYLGIKMGFGYIKIVPKYNRWKFWQTGLAHQQVRVMGGCLTEKARKVIKEKNTNTQEYFEGVGYMQDEVWTRPSRVSVQVALVFTYIVATTSFLGVLALGAAEIADIAERHQV